MGQVPDTSSDDAKTPSVAGRLLLGIATTGRRQVLADTTQTLALQTRKPDLLVLSVAESGDVDGESVESLPFPTQVLPGPKGLTTQRNRILDLLRPGDILLFLDDDYLMAPDFLARLGQLFDEMPDLVMATGTVLADGVVGTGLTHADGAAVLASDAGAAPGAVPTRAYSTYGCNMALRADPVLEHNVRFDEALPLYGWLEDLDFSRQMSAHGAIVKDPHLRGVHLGTKLSGRSPGLRLGYSQMANPLYLARKGTMTRKHARNIMMRNFTSNLAYSIRPRPWTDSRGRLRGNLLALWEAIRGTGSPARASEL